MDTYEKKYKEIVGKVRKAYLYAQTDSTKAVLKEIFPELAESEDEKVRKEIVNYFQCQSEEEPTRKEIHDKWIAWIENIPYTIDHEKREGFHLGYKAGLERGEKKSEENKGNIGGISPNWSEEDEKMLDSVIGDILNADTFLGGKETASYKCDWLKSIKDRVQPQPKQEWSEEDEEILRTILSDGIRGAELDMLQVNWLKSLRPQNRWKPSEDDIIILEKLIKGELEPKVFQATLQGILEQLKKLKEG